MLAKSRIISLICVGVVLLGGGIVYANLYKTDSPLAHNSQLDGIQEKWGENLLLPTYMPKNYSVLDATVNNTGTQQLIIETDLLTIEEEHTTNKKVDRLAFGQKPNETVEQTVARVQKTKALLRGGTNEILDIEPVKLGDETGYWYKLNQGFSAGTVQRVDFIQKGLFVNLSAPLSLSKEEFLKTAGSFAIVNIQHK